MLKIASSFKPIPIICPLNSNVTFRAGQIAQIHNKVMIVGGNTSSPPIGIIDDEFDPLNGISTISNSEVVLYDESLTIETDQFEKAYPYQKGYILFCSQYGKFTSNQINAGDPPVGVVEEAPTLINPLLKLKWTYNWINHYPNNPLAQLNMNVSKPANGTQLSLNLGTVGGSGGSIVTIPGSIYNGQINSSQPISGSKIIVNKPLQPAVSYGFIGIPPGFFDDADKTEVLEKEFEGILMPDGTRGSVCIKCNLFNGYVIKKDYICYNCAPVVEE
jgi:hypothetical protein